jgi:CheY-like chemotaxis protein
VALHWIRSSYQRQDMDNSERLFPSRVNQLVILIVDDEPVVVDLVRIALEDEGYFLLAAADGEEALVLSRTFPGAIHLLLTDVQMPNLGGLQLRERFREERPATRVLLMSGQAHMAAEQAFLPKPFSPAVLKERVRQMLYNKAGPELEGCQQVKPQVVSRTPR